MLCTCFSSRWIFFAFVHFGLVCCVQKYYMEDDCGKVIDMDYEEITAGRLLVTRRNKYRNQLSCYVTIVAPSNKRLIVVFRSIDIEFEFNCDDDYVTILDGYSQSSPVISGFPERFCGKSVPRGSYVTSGRNLTVYFRSDHRSGDDGFEIVFTAFYESSECHTDELHCNNGRCIDGSLSCNGVNNCGDGSDECNISQETAYAIILSVFLLTLVALGLITIYRKHNKQKRDTKMLEKRALYYNHCGSTDDKSSKGEPCLLCHVSLTNPSWIPDTGPPPHSSIDDQRREIREPEVFIIDDYRQNNRCNWKRASV